MVDGADAREWRRARRGARRSRRGARRRRARSGPAVGRCLVLGADAQVDGAEPAALGACLERTHRPAVALRGLARRPGFAATASLTAALGIAATTAVFSVVDATVLRALRLPHQDRVVAVWSRFDRYPGQDFAVSAAEFTDLAADVRSFERIGAWSGGSLVFGAERGAPARTRRRGVHGRRHLRDCRRAHGRGAAA